jgi:hypothetical protein
LLLLLLGCACQTSVQAVEEVLVHQSLILCCCCCCCRAVPARICELSGEGAGACVTCRRL